MGTLPVVDRQRIEIGGTPRVVIMDEPAATLTKVQISDLFGMIAELTAHGIAIVYVSHRLDEVARLADRGHHPARRQGRPDTALDAGITRTPDPGNSRWGDQ